MRLQMLFVFVGGAYSTHDPTGLERGGFVVNAGSVKFRMKAGLYDFQMSHPLHENKLCSVNDF